MKVTLPEETSKNFQSCKEIVPKSMKNMLIIGEDHPRYFPPEIAQKIINLEKYLIDNFNPDIIFLEGCEYIREDFLLSIRHSIMKAWGYDIELIEPSKELEEKFKDYLRKKFNIFYLDEPSRWVRAGLGYAKIPFLKRHFLIEDEDLIIQEIWYLLDQDREEVFQRVFCKTLNLKGCERVVLICGTGHVEGFINNIKDYLEKYNTSCKVVIINSNYYKDEYGTLDRVKKSLEKYNVEYEIIELTSS
ncbi:MAG: hypothetical protein ACO2OO_02440 [Candidatus Aenigmatarchaeota archaeon]|jgi:hypothetical protein